MLKSHSSLRRMAATLSVVAISALSLVNVSSAGATVPAASNWVQSGAPLSGPSPRYDSSMVFDAATGTTVLFGGFNGSELAETWTWNGSVWTKLSPAVSPPALRGAAMVFDTATNNVVLFGGLSATGLSADTWTWDGTTWTKLAATGPSPRSGAAMAYDSATHSVVLFGGNASTGPLSDTWTWNGTAWTMPTLTSTAPVARFESSMAYDAATQSVVLYGGKGSSGAISDTWTWDGTNWTKQPVASPSGRFGSSMIFDTTSNDVVLFGGNDGTDNSAETWNWNGTYWILVSSATNPSARYLSAMSYNTLSGSATLFGGADASSILSDTYSFNVAPSAPRSVKATSNANTQSVVTWNAPASNGGSAILGYTVVATDVTMASRGGQTCAATTATTCTVTRLTNGDQYVFVVTATNAVGTSASASSNVVRPATAPGAPTITSVIPGAGQATVSWTAPTVTGGTPVASYRVIAKPGAAFCHVPRGSTSCRIVGLHNGARYTFTMTATNAAGTSIPSVASALVQPRTLPSAPFITTMSVAGNYVTVRWTAPISNGGVRLIGYNVYVGAVPSGAGQRIALPVHYTQFSYTFQGLKGHVVYIIVRAVNVAGIGPFSKQVAAVVK
jgi:hypothetical protein